VLAVTFLLSDESGIYGAQVTYEGPTGTHYGWSCPDDEIHVPAITPITCTATRAITESEFVTGTYTFLYLSIKDEGTALQPPVINYANYFSDGTFEENTVIKCCHDLNFPNITVTTGTPTPTPTPTVTPTSTPAPSP
jgi:hypothetical protein